MPRYSYECSKCNNQKELTLKVDDRDKPVECDDCGSQMARITALTAPPRFNGTGFTPKFHR